MPNPRETAPLPPNNGFALTENEQLWGYVSDDRLKRWLHDPLTTVHQMEVSNNSYGGFLFITLSRMRDERRELKTFYGMGYHEHREQWIEDRWHFYTPSISPKTTRPLSREEVDEILDHRQRDNAEEKRFMDQEAPSQRAILFSMLADLTDEDGALAELDDLASLGWLFDDDITDE